MGLFGINQSKNASSNASTSSTNSNNSDSSTGSHNTDLSGSVHSDTAYDSHGVVNAGAGSTVNLTDGGLVAGALAALKGLAPAGPSAGESHYDSTGAPAGGIPMWAWIAGSVALVVMLGGIAYVATRK